MKLSTTVNDYRLIYQDSDTNKKLEHPINSSEVTAIKKAWENKEPVLVPRLGIIKYTRIEDIRQAKIKNTQWRDDGKTRHEICMDNGFTDEEKLEWKKIVHVVSAKFPQATDLIKMGWCKSIFNWEETKLKKDLLALGGKLI